MRLPDAPENNNFIDLTDKRLRIFLDKFFSTSPTVLEDTYKPAKKKLTRDELIFRNTMDEFLMKYGPNMLAKGKK